MESADSQKRWWDLPAVFLLVIILMDASTRLLVTNWTSNLNIVQTLTNLGLIAGLALGYSRFSSRRALFFAVVYGLYAVPWQLGSTYDSSVPWTERLLSLSGRLNIIFQHLFHRQAVPDSLLFLVLMAILFWILSVHAGYSLTRHASPWSTVLPTGLALVVIHSYDSFLGSRTWYLVVYLFFALVLVARLVYLQNRERWDHSNTYTPPHIGIDFIRIALISTLVLLVLAWAVPARADSLQAAANAWQRIKQPWNDIRDNFDNAFASLRSSVGIVNDYYGSSMSLGRGNRLSDNVVFSVVTPPDPPPGTRYYWRARVYDTYQNGQWSSTLDGTSSVTPDNFNLKLPEEKDRAVGLYSFAFTMDIPVSTIFAAPQPVWVSRPVKAQVAYNPDGTVDVGAFQASPAIQAGETYNVRASLSGATAANLRAAGTNYPDWITQRYLELPDSITPRTIQLAKEITAGLDTPYDKATAITAYLRSNIQYNASIAELPTNQDLVDWFLFDYKKGFCNYYATAEIVLLRAVGVPARMAVGYAEGEPQELDKTQFVVRQRDAHAWPEVYFPNTGWIEFEPTVSQPALIRPTGVNATNNQAPGTSGPEDQLNAAVPTPDMSHRQGGAVEAVQSSNLKLTAILIGSALALALLLIPLFRRKRLYEKLPSIPIWIEKGFRRVGLRPPALLHRWARQAALSPLARAYLEINHALARLGKRPKPTDTPAERAASLTSLIPEADPSTQRLLLEYQTATYSLGQADLQSARQAGSEIRSLSYRALIQRWLRGPSDPKEKLYRSGRW